MPGQPFLSEAGKADVQPNTAMTAWR